jgi:GT2 family glycosyltransferase
VNPAIIVLSYNHPQLTARAVRSALAHEPASLILVHNGSEARHIDELKRNFPSIDHLEIQPNAGYGAGVNAGLRRAFLSAPWAVLLTNDSELLNLPALPAAPCILAPQVFCRQTSRIDSAGGLFFPASGKLRHCRNVEEFRSAHRLKHALPYIPGTAFLLHRQIFSEIGPLREDMGLYWEDVDWSVRMFRAGKTLAVDETWHVRHGMSKTGRSNPLYSLYYFQRNRKRISWAYTPPLGRCKLAVVLLADWLRLFIKSTLRRRSELWHYYWKILLD